jgi:hypothetical protein
MGGYGETRKAKESASFLKKRSKKLFDSEARAVSRARAQINKVFFASFLFTKKKTFPSSSPDKSHHEAVAVSPDLRYNAAAR